MRDGVYWVVEREDFTASFVIGVDDPDNVDNVDAQITLPDGSGYFATFLTTTEIDKILRRWATTGEAGHGSYFRCPGLVIVPRPGISSMLTAIEQLVKSGEIRHACPPLIDEPEPDE